MYCIILYTYNKQVEQKNMTIFIILLNSRWQPPSPSYQWPRPKYRSCQQRSLTCKTLNGYFKALLKWANWHQYKNNRSSNALDWSVGFDLSIIVSK